MSDNLKLVKFKDLNIDDPFFDSLKADYKEFPQWFQSKGERDAFVQFKDDGTLNGLLAYKLESNYIEGINPPMYATTIFKIATFKINPHGTKLGERFIKKSLDLAFANNADICYFTSFPKQEGLLALFGPYGFCDVGVNDRGEHFFVKQLKGSLTNDIYRDYPRINATANTNKYLLGIHPEYHSNMFPDSILHNESVNILEDVSYTNSVHKIYICRMNGVRELRTGDVIIIYRTKAQNQPAYYSSVATSVCTVEECKTTTEFPNFDTFYRYCKKHSIFDEGRLRNVYNDRRYTWFVIKMLYNAAFTHRIIQGDLINKFGLSQNAYWGFMKLTDDQFLNIIKAGGVIENLIVY